MRARFLLPSVLSTLALAAAGCGGSDGGAVAGGETAASLIPANAAGYVSINADLESEQWRQVKELADKFPGRDKAVAAFLEELSAEGLDWEEDVDPALGPEVALAVLVDGGEPRLVALTQPDDEAKLQALAAKAEEEAVTREIEDWWAIAETAADLDAFEQARDEGALADDDTFQQAVADLPGEAVATFFVDGEAIQTALEREGGSNPLGAAGRFVWMAGALEALDEGAKLAGTIRMAGGEAEAVGEAYTPKLLERVPSGSLAVLSFRNVGEALDELRSNELFQQLLPEGEALLGVTLTELGDLFRGEGAAYVRPGLPIPEASLALEVDDEAKALATVDALAKRLAPFVEGRTGSAEVDGVSTRYLEIEGFRITYATFDGLLFLTSGPTGLAEFRSDREKIGDDDAFTRAKEAVGMGDETSGFLYVDLSEAIGLIQGLAGIAGESVSPDVSANLAPLDAFIANGSRDGDDIDFAAFLGIR